MSVPKCKECESHRMEKGKGIHWAWVFRNCVHKKSPITNSVDSRSYNSSPKWCPKRLEIRKEGEK